MANQRQFANHLCNLEKLAKSPFCVHQAEKSLITLMRGFAGKGPATPPGTLPATYETNGGWQRCVEAPRKTRFANTCLQDSCALTRRIEQVPNWSWFTRQGRADALVVVANFSCDFPSLVRICLFFVHFRVKLKKSDDKHFFFHAPRHSC